MNKSKLEKGILFLILATAVATRFPQPGSTVIAILVALLYLTLITYCIERPTRLRILPIVIVIAAISAPASWNLTRSLPIGIQLIWYLIGITAIHIIANMAAHTYAKTHE